MAHAQGVGRHSQSEVEQLLEEDLSALSDFLGKVQWVRFEGRPNRFKTDEIYLIYRYPEDYGLSKIFQ